MDLNRKLSANAVLAAALMAGGSLLSTTTALAAAPRQYQFDVLLDSKPIGTHRFEVSPATDGTERIISEAAFQVRILGFNAYTYRHRADESWAAGCLTGIDAQTSDNGRLLTVRGERDSQGFRLHSPARQNPASCVVSYAYWNPKRLLVQRTLLNPQTGQFDAVHFEDLGSETLQLKGNAVPANRYRLKGPQYEIDLWYGQSGEWLQLESSTSSKRRLKYRLRN